MAQKPVEIILMRQLASYLPIPIFVVGADGTLLFYNEPAEKLLGRRFDDAGEMSLDVWSTIFLPTDEHGRPLAPDAVPLVVALREHRPIHTTIGVTGLNGMKNLIEVTAFPLEGQGARRLGAVAMFWPAQKP